jgi:hypothetical protein
MDNIARLQELENKISDLEQLQDQLLTANNFNAERLIHVNTNLRVLREEFKARCSNTFVEPTFKQLTA